MVFDSKVFDFKAFDSKDFDSKVFDSKDFDSKVFDSKVSDSEFFDSKVFDSKVYDYKVFDSKVYEVFYIGSNYKWLSSLLWYLLSYLLDEIEPAAIFGSRQENFPLAIELTKMIKADIWKKQKRYRGWRFSYTAEPQQQPKETCELRLY